MKKRPMSTLPLLLLVTLAAPAAAGAAADAVADLPDPTRPDGQPVRAQPGSRPALVLQSTLITGDKKTAVINGQTATIGTRIRGARVVDIRPDAVVVTRNARRIVLRLREGDKP